MESIEQKKKTIRKWQKLTKTLVQVQIFRNFSQFFTMFHNFSEIFHIFFADWRRNEFSPFLERLAREPGCFFYFVANMDPFWESISTKKNFASWYQSLKVCPYPSRIRLPKVLNRVGRGTLPLGGSPFEVGIPQNKNTAWSARKSLRGFKNAHHAHTHLVPDPHHRSVNTKQRMEPHGTG